MLTTYFFRAAAYMLDFAFYTDFQVAITFYSCQNQATKKLKFEFVTKFELDSSEKIVGMKNVMALAHKNIPSLCT